MSRWDRVLPVWLVLMGMLFSDAEPAAAQRTALPKKRVVTATSPKEEPEAPGHVVIKREALNLIDPKVYQIPLQLEAVRAVQIFALTDGVVRAVPAKPGQKLEAQSEAVRLDSREQQFLLDRAKANYSVSQIEVKLAKSRKDAGLLELAEAKLDVAKVELDMATFRFERSSIRVPFDGKVFRVQAVVGQYVRAGEPLLKFADTSKLRVEIPVDRKQAAGGKTIEIRIEETPAQATIKEILPLAPRFEPLRDLINSAASAIVDIDNADGRFKVGQAVFAPLIPQQVVSAVPTASLENTGEGEQRKVQVVRGDTIRDVRVQLHGQVGGDRIFVSGPFAPGDEVIVSCEPERLPDGTLIRSGGGDVAGRGGKDEENERERRTPTRTRPGF